MWGQPGPVWDLVLNNNNITNTNRIFGGCLCSCRTTKKSRQSCTTSSMLKNKTVRARGSPAPQILPYPLLFPFQTTPESHGFVIKQVNALLASNPWLRGSMFPWSHKVRVSSHRSWAMGVVRGRILIPYAVKYYLWDCIFFFWNKLVFGWWFILYSRYTVGQKKKKPCSLRRKLRSTP